MRLLNQIALSTGVLTTQLVFAQAPLIRNYTPPAWQAREVGWSRDANPRNKIDDLIESSSLDEFNVVVNFSECVTTTDVTMLESISERSEVQMPPRYLSSVPVSGLTKADIEVLASAPNVAFIELQTGFRPSLTTSTGSICVVSPSGCSSSVAEVFPDLNGSGINIAIMDTGVHNTHRTFNEVTMVGSYDAVTQAFVDPPDDVGHGTLVASIALGQGAIDTFGAVRVRPGVAPAAGLIDVRVFELADFLAPEEPCSADVLEDNTWMPVFDGLQTLYDMRDEWDVDIINMSFENTCHTNGLDAFSQLVDLAESMGIVVVAAIGNKGPSNSSIGTPAAASRAITVASSDDKGTVDRSDDVIASDSSKGPRDDDDDADLADELKPDVTAPGVDITGADTGGGTLFQTMSGTSMAAPHVAGLAALILQQRPNINPASVKSLIIASADTSPTGLSSVWDERWGWGLVNALTALEMASATVDLTFPNHPPTPSWLSPDIKTSTEPKEGEETMGTVRIRNDGPGTALDVRVGFGVHVFSASPTAFYDIGTVGTDIPESDPMDPDDGTDVSITWTPQSSGHQCLSVDIGYGPDSDYSNNKAQRNLQVAQSPVEFVVRNTVTESPVQIDITGILDDPRSDWTFTLSKSSVVLGKEDCPETIIGELFPPSGAAPGAVERLHVRAVAQTENGPVELGGVTIQDEVDQQQEPSPVPCVLAPGVLLLLIVGVAWVTRGKRLRR